MSRHQMFTLEDKCEVTYTKLQQTKFMDSKCKSAFCIVNSDKACISMELAGLTYDKV